MPCLPDHQLHLPSQYHKQTAVDFSGGPCTEQKEVSVENEWFSDSFFFLSLRFTCKHWCHFHRVFLWTMIKRWAEQPFRTTSELISYVDHRSSFFSGRKGRRDRQRAGRETARKKDFYFLFGVLFLVWFFFSWSFVLREPRSNETTTCSSFLVGPWLISSSSFLASARRATFSIYSQAVSCSRSDQQREEQCHCFLCHWQQWTEEMLITRPSVKNSRDHFVSLLRDRVTMYLILFVDK